MRRRTSFPDVTRFRLGPQFGDLAWTLSAVKHSVPPEVIAVAAAKWGKADRRADRRLHAQRLPGEARRAQVFWQNWRAGQLDQVRVLFAGRTERQKGWDWWTDRWKH